MRVDLGEFRTAYLAEVEEHLANVSARLLEIERAAGEGRPAPKALRDLMRLLHTIKGLSAMVGIDAVVTLAHRMESTVRAVEVKNAPPTAKVVETLLDALRTLEEAMRAVAGEREVQAASPSLMASLDVESTNRAGRGALTLEELPLDPALSEKLGAPERDQIRDGLHGGRRLVRIEFAPSPAKAAAGTTITSIRTGLEALGEMVKVIPMGEPPSERAPTGLVFVLLLLTTATDEALATAANGCPVIELLEAATREADSKRDLPEEAPAVVVAAGDVGPLEGGGSGVLRVEVERIDDALERLSGLIVTRARLALAITNLRAAGVDTRDLVSIHQENGRHLRELRSAVLRLRMIPVSTILDTLPLMMRGLARSTGKDVKLVIGVGSAELDKTVGEKLLPALVHLIRNAVDHGIEPAEQRVANGKPPYGVITISCFAQGSRIVEVRVEDDGGGVDREAVAARAGRVGAELDDSALLEALCRPGFSTRREANMNSGRGMGMDIVHKIVAEGLGGAIQMKSERGKGTSFILQVPLTIAIVDAFTIRCGGERFVVPVPAVEEIFDLEGATLTRMDSSGVRILSRRGESVPLLDLASVFGLGKPNEFPTKQALLVRRGREEPIAFAVERVIAQQEAVVRPLDETFLGIPGISGATDLGDGKPTIVLDLPALFGKLKERAA